MRMICAYQNDYTACFNYSAAIELSYLAAVLDRSSDRGNN